MNTLLLAAALPLLIPAADTNAVVSEVSTSAPIGLNLSRIAELRVTLALEAGESDNVEVSFGNDANGDGVLDLLEADLTFGYDCGSWFVADTRTGEIVPHAPTTWVLRRRMIDPSWNLVRVLRRGTSEIQASATLNHTKLSFAVIVH